ncbi:MAG: tetratricopeptide repeat protein [Bacteroidota bacterium]
MVAKEQQLKIIFKGTLEFGTEKSYRKVHDMYERRMESYYKKDVLFKEEDLFDEESSCVNIPRVVIYGTVKKWKGTINLFEYLAQFAVAGQMCGWLINEGKILEHSIIEPHSDKVAVKAFRKGRELVQKEGKEKEAMDALNTAIQKYERHAQAYERRGFINYQLKNYNDALYDFTKSINIYPNNPDPYFGRGNVYIIKEELDKAIQDLDQCINMSIPLQKIYWKARRIKGECLAKKGEHKGAALEFKLFLQRKFPEGDSNHKWKKYIYTQYGQTLLELGNYSDAVTAFNEALKLEQASSEKVSEADPLLYRGIALQKAGKKGFVKDWKQAAKLGSEKAQALMEEYA